MYHLVIESILSRFEKYTNLGYFYPWEGFSKGNHESWRGNIQFCVIISGTPQLVLKCLWGRYNISLMFLFPWLDWGIDISDFEKIDFLGHGRFLAFSAPCKSDFLTWAIILRAPLKVPRVKIYASSLP